MLKYTCYTVLVILALIMFSSCTANYSQLTYSTSQTITVTSLLATKPTTIIPSHGEANFPVAHTIDEIRCDLQLLTSPSGYTLDQIVLGQSVQEDVQTLLGEPEDQTEYQKLITWWWFEASYAWVTFDNGLAIRREEPRFLLGDIIAHYGAPTQVVWEIPAVDSSELWFSTILLYPEQGVIFTDESQTIFFSSESSFPSGIVLLPSEFDKYLLEYQIVTSPYYEYVTFPWPCE